MHKILHRAEDRGRADYGWLKTRYSFSFAGWHEPSRMGFGALRVLNDDTIAPASGFPMHGHRDMEIITIVTEGTLTHKDSLGNMGTVRAGEVQVMSAGTGVMHSEFNASETEPLTLFQIWIETAAPGIAPAYAQKAVGTGREGTPELLVGPAGTADLAIAQDAFISRLRLTDGARTQYAMRRRGHGAYVFVINGEIAVEGEALRARDALCISNAVGFEIKARGTATALIIEVPLA